MKVNESTVLIAATLLLVTLALVMAWRASAEVIGPTLLGSPEVGTTKYEELDDINRRAWEAEQLTRAQRSIKGPSVGEFLDDFANQPSATYSEWIALPDSSEGFTVEFVIKLDSLRSPISYGWAVTFDGRVRPTNLLAASITAEQA